MQHLGWQKVLAALKRLNCLVLFTPHTTEGAVKKAREQHGIEVVGYPHAALNSGPPAAVKNVSIFFAGFSKSRPPALMDGHDRSHFADDGPEARQLRTERFDGSRDAQVCAEGQRDVWKDYTNSPGIADRTGRLGPGGTSPSFILQHNSPINTRCDMWSASPLERTGAVRDPVQEYFAQREAQENG